MNDSVNTIWAFSDVDDTLIASSRLSPCDGSVAAAVDNKGAVCGWLTPKQKQFLDLLCGGKDAADSHARLVLTTARTSQGVAQLTLPLPAANVYAIVSFGGLILTPDGTPEPRFYELIARGCEEYAPVLADLCSGMQAYCLENSFDARVRVASDHGLDLFVSIKHNARDLAAMAVLRDVLASRLPEGWSLHFNGNFLAALPPFLGKDKAVRWFMDHFVAEGELTLGLGDSHSDLSFMALCDLAIAPTASQVFSHLNPSPKGGAL